MLRIEAPGIGAAIVTAAEDIRSFVTAREQHVKALPYEKPVNSRVFELALRACEALRMIPNSSWWWLMGGCPVGISPFRPEILRKSSPTSRVFETTPSRGVQHFPSET